MTRGGAQQLRGAAGVGVGTHVDEQVEVDRGDPPGLEREAHPRPLCGPGRRDGERLVGAEGEARCPARAQRDERAEVLHEKVRSAGRSAGDPRSRDADTGGGQAEPLGEEPADPERRLGGRADHEPAILVEPGEGERRLERHRRRERQPPLARDHVLGARQGPLDVSGLGGDTRRDARVVRGRRLGVEHGRQRLEVELEQARGAMRELDVLGGDGGEPVAHEPRLAAQEGGRVRRHEHRGDPGERDRGRRVDGADAGVGDRRAAHRHVQQAGQSGVSGEGGLPRGAPQAHAPSLAAAARTAATGRA